MARKTAIRNAKTLILSVNPFFDAPSDSSEGIFAPMSSSLESYPTRNREGKIVTAKAKLTNYIKIAETDLPVYLDYISNKDAKPTTKAGKLAKQSLAYLEANGVSGYYNFTQRSRGKSPYVDIRNVGRMGIASYQLFFSEHIIQMIDRIPASFKDDFRKDALDVKKLIDITVSKLDDFNATKEVMESNGGIVPDDYQDKINFLTIAKENMLIAIVDLITKYPLVGSSANGYVKTVTSMLND